MKIAVLRETGEAQTRVALGVADDVVSPDANTTPGAPIDGMLILNADEVKQGVSMKPDICPSFAGIENDLRIKQNTTLLFGDAKDSMGKLLYAVKAL